MPILDKASFAALQKNFTEYNKRPPTAKEMLAIVAWAVEGRMRERVLDAAIAGEIAVTFSSADEHGRRTVSHPMAQLEAQLSAARSELEVLKVSLGL